MPKEKKIRMKCTVEILFEGYGDMPCFKELVKEAIKELHYDVTRAGVDGSATVKIKKPSKSIKCEELS